MSETTVVSIPLDAIVVVEGANPRTTFDPAAIKELANSIKSIGLLNPITVRWSGSEKEEKYDLVAGHRRYLAVSSLSDVTHIDAIVHDADWSDGAIAAVAENVARADLNPVDEARAYQELMTEAKVKPRALSQLVGRSEKRIKERVALLALPPKVLELIAVGQLSPRVAPVLYPVAKLSPDVAEWLGIVASQDSYAAEMLITNLAGALKDLRRDVLALHPDATPPFVLQCQEYMASENREVLRRVISDELAAKIAELPQFCSMDPWRFGQDDGDAAVAYGAALDLSKGHFRTVFILDPEWAADRVAVNYEHALKRALEHTRATEKARAPGGHEHVHVQKRESDKAARQIAERLAPRIHERNAAIGRAILKHKFKPDPMAIKLLAVLAAAHLSSTPAHAWALADETLAKPEVTTRKDGSTKFKLVLSETPYQLQQGLIERVHEAKSVPQLLRLILGPIIAGNVIDGRSIAQSNRPARVNFDYIAGTEDVKQYLLELASEFDFDKPYETAQEKAAQAEAEAVDEAFEKRVEEAQLHADQLEALADQATARFENSEEEDPDALKELEEAAEEAWKAYEEASEAVTALYNDGPAAVGGGEDEGEEDDEDEQPAIELEDEVPEDAGDVVPDPLDPDDTDPDDNEVDDPDASGADEVDHALNGSTPDAIEAAEEAATEA